MRPKETATQLGVRVNLKDKKVLIFGGSGLLGTALREILDANGVSYLAPSSSSVNVYLTHNLDGVFAGYKPDVVFNLFVAFGGILANERHPGQIFFDNLQGNLNVIEACRRYGIEKLIQISSQCAYADTQPVPFKESEIWSHGLPTKNNSPYGISKRVLHVMLEAYRDEFGLNAITLIPSNMYGPNDNFHPAATHVIPSLIRRFVDAKESGQKNVEIWGTGMATREFLYVKDAARALVLAAENYDRPNPINIGTGKEVSIKELSELIAKLIQYDGTISYNNNGRDGQKRRVSCNEKAKSEFGFEASYSLEDGLRATLDFFYKNRENLRETNTYA